MAYRGDQRDPYVYAGTEVLKNIYDIQDAEKLQELETELSYRRFAELKSQPIQGDFDLEHLQAIHKYAFQDIYPWAGEFRECNLAKDASPFANADYIESYGRQVLGKLEKERETWFRMPQQVDLIERLAHYLGELNALHPFREGNGRTQREFIGQLAREHGIKINWSKMDQDTMLKASIASFQGDGSQLVELIRNNSEPCALAVGNKVSKGYKM